MLASMGWLWMGWTAMASGQSADAAVNADATRVEAVLALEGASARLVPWSEDNAGRTLESLVPVAPREGQIVIVAVVDGSLAAVPAPVTASAESEVEVAEDGWPVVATDRVPTVDDAGFVVPESEPEPLSTGELTVVIPKDVYATQIEVSCPKAAFRERGRFELGTATVADVPDAECLISFKGGTVATRFRARPGHYACRSLGEATLACQPTP